MPAHFNAESIPRAPAARARSCRRRRRKTSGRSKAEIPGATGAPLIVADDRRLRFLQRTQLKPCRRPGEAAWQAVASSGGRAAVAACRAPPRDNPPRPGLRAEPATRSQLGEPVAQQDQRAGPWTATTACAGRSRPASAVTRRRRSCARLRRGGDRGPVKRAVARFDRLAITRCISAIFGVVGPDTLAVLNSAFRRDSASHRCKPGVASDHRCWLFMLTRSNAQPVGGQRGRQ